MGRSSPTVASTPWRSLVACALCLALTLAVVSSAGAHEGAGDGSEPAAASGNAGSKLKLRGCWMTVVLVPRPEDVLEAAFPRPIDLSRRFYGQSDALVMSWSLSCKRVKTKRKNIRNPILSLVAAPTGLVDEEGIPLASNFAHALVAVDANRRRLAKRLRRRGFPARKSGLGYRHSEPGVVPFAAALRVPDKYRLNVSASTLDVVHDHQDTFEYRARKGRRAVLQLWAIDALDRFCIVSAAADCAAALNTPRKGPLTTPFGGPSAQVFLGIDHARLPRVDLRLSRGPGG